VADVYDAVTSERVYKAAAPPHIGVRVIAEGAGSQFCPTVVAHFRSVVFPYPIGHEIALPDGRVGVVAGVDPACPDRPRVRVANGGGAVDEVTVDLAEAGASLRH
jgi:HD-GYP domain-containing protein (c-di-GMP phosphodiesterase class II)